MMHARYRTGAYGNYTLELYSLVGHSCLLQRSYRWHDRRIIRGRATARPKSSCAAGQWSRTSAWTATCTPYTPAACERRQREGEDTATAQTHQPALFRIGVSSARAIYLRAIPTTPVRYPFPPRLLRRAKLGERSAGAAAVRQARISILIAARLSCTIFAGGWKGMMISESLPASRGRALRSPALCSTQRGGPRPAGPERTGQTASYNPT
jgi:hypothetical protein